MYDSAEPWSGAKIAAFLGVSDNPARVRVTVSKIRRALKGTGWTISTNKGGTHAFGTYEVQRG